VRQEKGQRRKLFFPLAAGKRDSGGEKKNLSKAENHAGTKDNRPSLFAPYYRIIEITKGGGEKGIMNGLKEEQGVDGGSNNNDSKRERGTKY